MVIKVIGIMIISPAEFRLHRHKGRKSQGVISREGDLESRRGSMRDSIEKIFRRLRSFKKARRLPSTGERSCSKLLQAVAVAMLVNLAGGRQKIK
jgi:hypothetical protein